MPASDLSARYRSYIACLNRQDWTGLQAFVARDVRYNDEPVGFSSYRDMLQDSYRDIPDLRFGIELLVCEGAHVASRIRFDCTPIATLLGLEVNGRTISFTENVFYRFAEGRITEVWSILDKPAIEAQLRAG